MKIAFFGATGRVGSLILKKALADGHEVRALVRHVNPAFEETRHLEIIYGDAKVYTAIEKTMAGCDAVVMALNTDQTTTLSEAIAHIIEVMKQQNLKRIVTIGTAGILNSRREEGVLRYNSSESRQKKKTAAKEHEKVYRALQKTNLNWTIICPTALINDNEVGIYKYERDFLPIEGKRISVADTATFSYSVLIEQLFIRHRVGIAY